MRTIPKEESLDIEFKSDLKYYPDHDLNVKGLSH